MQTWLIDIGNTKTAFGLREAGQIVSRHAVRTIKLAHYPLSFIEAGSRALIASVVPNATENLLEKLKQLAIEARTIKAIDVPMKSEYLEMENLGTDRMLTAFAGYELYAKDAGRDLIIVNLGTATTFECVTKAGVYLGGAITLGIGSIIDAIHERTAQLPMVPLEIPTSAVGRTTIQSLQSGILNSSLLGIREFTHALSAEAFPEVKPLVIATGGLAEFTHTHLPGRFDFVDQDLVLKGLGLLSEPRFGEI